MSLDETRALAALAASRRVIDELIGSRQGRIFSTGGDSVLAEFLSGDEAVRCGMEIQRALARSAQVGTETLRYRIGIHAGHVYPQQDDLLGETVNVAARLESIAYPGGLCISHKVRDLIDIGPDLDVEDMGAQLLKGIGEPIGVARIRLGEPEPVRELRSRFGVAVLPFQAADQDRHWGEGLAADVIGALSRFSNLAVLAQASSFPFRGERDPRRVAAALGVRFVVDGAVRVEVSQFRLSVQLVDGSSGAVLWADRYRCAPEDLLTAQDRLVENIVGTLVGRLALAGAQAALQRRTDNLGAFDFLVQGSYHADRLDPASTGRALECFDRALAIDPDYPLALAMSALMRLRHWALNAGEGDLGPVAETAARALALDPADGWCHLVTGQVAMYRGQLDAAEVHHKKANALNPYDARIMALWSPLATYLGKPEEGKAWIDRAIRLNPYHPAWYATNLGLACYCAGQYEQAAVAYASVAAPQIGVLAGLAACRAQSGDRNAAAAARSTLLNAEPKFSTEVFIATRPFKYAVDRDHLRDGLRKADLPA